MTRPFQRLSRLWPLGEASFQVRSRRSCHAVPVRVACPRQRSNTKPDCGGTSRLLYHRPLQQSGARLAVLCTRGYATDEQDKRTSSATAASPPKQPKTPILDRVKSNVAKLKTHENIYTLPNILTVSRLIAAPVVGYLVVKEQHAWAVGLFAYAGITDLVDGWIARKWKLQTVVGSVIDPGADKLLMIVLVGCLAFKGALPLWLATIIMGRDASLAIAAIYYRYASLPQPKTFTRYWDFSIPSAEVHPTQVSKYNTFLQLVLIGATTVLPLAPQTLLGLDVKSAVTTMQYVVAATTLWSGASYTWLKDAVVILGEDEELKKRQGVRGRMIIAVSFGSFVGLAAWLGMTKDAKSVDGEVTSQ